MEWVSKFSFNYKRTFAVNVLVYFEIDLWIQLKEASLWDSAAVVRSSPAVTGTCATSVSPLSKWIHFPSHNPRLGRAHGRHVPKAGYQQLMDIINLPRRNVVNQPSTILKSTNCGLGPPSLRTASPSAVGKSASKSVQCVKDAPQRDDTLKPTDILVQFVDNL